MTKELLPIVIGALIAGIQGLIFFVLVGIKESIAQLWTKLNATNAMLHDADKRLAVIESRSHERRL